MGRLRFHGVIEKDVVFVSAGYYHTTAIKQDGSLWATGLNNHGQLGDGTVTQRLGYVEVMDDGVKDVCTGEYTTFVIKKDGSLWATGLNNYGQLGDGTVTTAGYSSLALKQDGS